jgi:hypothetical protein
MQTVPPQYVGYHRGATLQTVLGRIFYISSSQELDLCVCFPSVFSSHIDDGRSKDNTMMGNKSNVGGMIRDVGPALVHV